MINISTIKKFLIGIPIGIINVTLGAGGGIISVPILKAAGMSQKQAQANTIAIILPLSVISFYMYIKKGFTSFNSIITILPASALGAIIGTVVFSKLSNRFLSVAFSFFMIVAHYNPSGSLQRYQSTNKAVQAIRITNEYLHVYLSNEP